MAATHSIHKSINIVVDEKRELVYYVANESHPTEWNMWVISGRLLLSLIIFQLRIPLSIRKDRLADRKRDILQVSVSRVLSLLSLSSRTERAHNRLAIDLDYGFCVWMNSIASAPTCRFYSLRWTDGEVLPKAVCAAEVSFFVFPSN